MPATAPASTIVQRFIARPVPMVSTVTRSPACRLERRGTAHSADRRSPTEARPAPSPNSAAASEPDPRRQLRGELHLRRRCRPPGSTRPAPPRARPRRCRGRSQEPPARTASRTARVGGGDGLHVDLGAARRAAARRAASPARRRQRRREWPRPARSRRPSRAKPSRPARRASGSRRPCRSPASGRSGRSAPSL